MRPLGRIKENKYIEDKKAKKEAEKNKSKMLGGLGHMVGPRTMWWR